MEITKVLKFLEITDTGTYDNQMYILDIADSDEYARLYTKLSQLAINSEYPSFETNTYNTTTKVINYFELEVDNIKYLLFLIANFNDDKYYLKIREA